MGESDYQVLKDRAFDDWFEEQPERIQSQVLTRILKIEKHGYFGDHKSVSEHETGFLKRAIWELRWADGKRVYYAYIPVKRILLLLGGNKNGQDQDIAQAKNIFIKATAISKKKK